MATVTNLFRQCLSSFVLLDRGNRACTRRQRMLVRMQSVPEREYKVLPYALTSCHGWICLVHLSKRGTSLTMSLL